jgi:hypothetical protein
MHAFGGTKLFSGGGFLGVAPKVQNIKIFSTTFERLGETKKSVD